MLGKVYKFQENQHIYQGNNEFVCLAYSKSREEDNADITLGCLRLEKSVD